MSVIGALALVLLVSAWLVVITRDLTALVQLSAVQGVVLAVVASLAGQAAGADHLYAAALLTLAVKGLAVPVVLQRVLRRIGPLRLPDAMFTTRTQAVLAFALTGAGYYIAAPLAAEPAGNHGAIGEVLPVALALVLIGAFVVVSRRLALTQAVGLLLVENGLFLAALAVAGGVPLAVDIAILAEVFVAMLIMGALVRRMHGMIGSISTEQFRRLKG